MRTPSGRDRPPPDDPAEDEADLWFLPGPDPAEDESRPALPGMLPTPAAPRRGLVELAEWRAAEGMLVQDLAALAQDHGRLEERTAGLGPGVVQRLAQAEASGLSWWTGDRVQPDRLAQWLAFRIGAAGEDGGALIRAAWAARRLAVPAPAAPRGTAAIAGHLGADAGGLALLAEEAAAALPAPGELGPVALGCAAFHLWRALDDRPDQLRGIEAAVLGSRLAAGPGPGRALPFLPLSLTGFAALTVSGSVERRLAGWVSGAHQSVLSALMTLDRLRQWQARATAETADLSGRTPALLIACLARHPLVAAPLAESETGASRAAVQRNLDRLHHRDLIREITGQGRFRLWAARL
ncbi:MAG: hypothetical protein IAE87_18395 [Rhodobacteraceae bacterium]|nr:hypothetical protein [Paracoccaceae bacterium]